MISVKRTHVWHRTYYSERLVSVDVKVTYRCIVSRFFVICQHKYFRGKINNDL
jgi:hypothetical protein